MLPVHVPRVYYCHTHAGEGEAMLVSGPGGTLLLRTPPALVVHEIFGSDPLSEHILLTMRHIKVEGRGRGESDEKIRELSSIQLRKALIHYQYQSAWLTPYSIKSTSMGIKGNVRS